MVVTAGDRITGYGVARQCLSGWKVGALCAEDHEEAMSLLSALSNATAGAVLHLDVPASARSLRDRLLALGFTPGFETTRMYRGTPPKIAAAERLFAVTTLELG